MEQPCFPGNGAYYALVSLELEQFSIECHKTKTKLIADQLGD